MKSVCGISRNGYRRVCAVGIFFIGLSLGSIFTYVANISVINESKQVAAGFEKTSGDWENTANGWRDLVVKWKGLSAYWEKAYRECKEKRCDAK